MLTVAPRSLYSLVFDLRCPELGKLLHREHGNHQDSVCSHRNNAVWGHQGEDEGNVPTNTGLAGMRSSPFLCSGVDIDSTP